MRLAKSASFTRWDARPLSPEQLAYAREDVVHLLELSCELERRLAASGRLEWAREECRALEQVERRARSSRRSSPGSRASAAWAPARRRSPASSWRGASVPPRRTDRTVQSVLADAALVEIASAGPATARELEQIRGVAQSSLRRRGAEVLEAVRAGAERRAEDHRAAERLPRHEAPDPADAPLIALCEALVRARAREADLAYELIAARADLQVIVAAPTGRRLGARCPHAPGLAPGPGRRRAARAARRPRLAVGSRGTPSDRAVAQRSSGSAPALAGRGVPPSGEATGCGCTP